MSIAANAENLQINATNSLDGLLREKVVLHEVVKTLRMRGRQAKVFIKIETAGTRKIKIASTMKLDQMLIKAKWRVTRGETEHDIGFRTNRGCHDTSGFATNLLVVFFYDDQHLTASCQANCS